MRTTLTCEQLEAAPPELKKPMLEWFVQVLWPTAHESTLAARVSQAMNADATGWTWLQVYDNFTVDTEGEFSYDHICCGYTERVENVLTSTPPPFMLWPD